MWRRKWTNDKWNGHLRRFYVGGGNGQDFLETRNTQSHVHVTTTGEMESVECHLCWRFADRLSGQHTDGFPGCHSGRHRFTVYQTRQVFASHVDVGLFGEAVHQWGQIFVENIHIVAWAELWIDRIWISTLFLIITRKMKKKNQC